MIVQVIGSCNLVRSITHTLNAVQVRKPNINLVGRASDVNECFMNVVNASEKLLSKSALNESFRQKADCYLKSEKSTEKLLSRQWLGIKSRSIDISTVDIIIVPLKICFAWWPGEYVVVNLGNVWIVAVIDCENAFAVNRKLGKYILMSQSPLQSKDR